MNHFFYRFYEFFKVRKLVLFGFLFLLLCGLLYNTTRLALEEDISKLIPQSEETKKLNEILNQTDFSDKIIVNITITNNGTINDLTDYASEIIEEIEAECTEFIHEIQGEVEDDSMIETMDFIRSNLPLFLEDNDYDYLSETLVSDSIRLLVNSNFKTLSSPSGLIAKTSIREDPFGLTFRALSKLNNLKISEDIELHNGFLVAKNKRNLLLFIKPKLPANETDGNKEFVEKLYNISHHLNEKYKKKAESEYYGSTIIAVSNANQIKKDIKYTVGIALTILLFILISFYRKLIVPIILFIPTIFGALIALLTLTILRDSVSAISLGIGSVLLGITIDYSLHILTHYKKNGNVQELYRNVTRPVFMSSITTAVAFLCLLFLKSQALQDLGIFAAVSVISSSILALLLIPLLYKSNSSKKVKNNGLIEKIANFNFESKGILIGACLLVFFISLFLFNNVKFNKDLNEMNYQAPEIKSAQKHLDSLLELSAKSIYIVAYGEDINEVIKANSSVYERLEHQIAAGAISSFSSIGSIVISEGDQKKKIDKWNSFWTKSKKETLKQDLIYYGEKVGFNSTAYQPFFNLIENPYSTKELSDYSSVNSLMTDEFISSSNSLKTAVSLVKLNDATNIDLRKTIDEMPNVIWIDRKEISEAFLGGLKNNFSDLIKYSFLAIFILLLLFFRNLELTILTIIPIGMTWFTTLGIMYLFQVEFTIFNAIISTFIFGLGVDYSIFITNGLIKDYTYNRNEITIYKTSIILSVITTLLGVGVLIFAKHPALKSISILSIIGISTTVIVAFTMQPFLFNKFVRSRSIKGLAPINIRLFLHSIFSLFIYGTGGMLLSIFSVTILKIIPVSKKIKYKWLHDISAKLVTLVLYSNPFVRKKVINSERENFEKPAIIIANHSSSLDTLTFGLLTSKIIYLVNDWVYKSPIFGILARVMGYYPITEGVNESLDHLKEKVRQGYSLVVFPESKRSPSNKIGRFHKGAFFLQENLKLDILPIYIHGNSEVMPKNDMIIYDGSITAVIGERISASDTSFGIKYKDRSKSISQFFKKEFLKIRNRIESEDYFNNILFSNYRYKESGLLDSIKRDFKENKVFYHTLSDAIPIKARICHIADDYGQLDILLVAKSIERRITTYIDNENKRSVAENCYTSKHRRVSYISNFNDFDPDKCDVLILNDSNVSNAISMGLLESFSCIFVLNASYPIENMEESKFSSVEVADKITILQKRK